MHIVRTMIVMMIIIKLFVECLRRPRLVLPKAYQRAVIDRAHNEVGHMAACKTMSESLSSNKYALTIICHCT